MAKRRSGAVMAALALCIAVTAVYVLLATNAAQPLADNAPMRETVGSSTNAEPPIPSASDAVPHNDAQPGDESGAIQGEYVPGVVLVQFGSGANFKDVSAAIAALPCIGDASSALADASMAADVVALPVAEGYSVADAIAALQQVDGTVNAQPNYLYHLVDDGTGLLGLSDSSAGAGLVAASVNRDLLTGTALLDALDDVNDPDGKKAAANDHSWHLASINAYEAWSIVKGESRSADDRVTVAVLDTGYDIDHEDLTAEAEGGIGGNVVAAYDATSNSSENYNAGIADIDGHGTHVAGIVAAIANNEKGVAGVSHNANVLPIQVFHTYVDDDGITQNGASSLSVYHAYKYIVKHVDAYNIRVANLSLGVKADSVSSQDQLLVDAAEEAYAVGVLTVCAAGNNASSGPYVDFPGDYLTHGMSVIALGKDRTRGSYSNYNVSPVEQKKDISAPGSSIYSTTYNGSYGLKSGTSMAAPVVSGVAALVFSANPSLSPGDAIDILHATALDLTPANSGANTAEGFDQYTGYGEVDAKAAVEGAGVYLSGDSTVLVGGSFALEPTVSAPGGSWSWSSGDTSIATVSDGVVTGVGAGVVTITATSGELSVTKDVTVYDITYRIQEEGADVDDLEVVDEIEIEAGESQLLRFAENPDTGLWYISSSDPSVMTTSLPSAGIIRATGVSAGEAYVTATLKENPGLVVRCKVVVCDATTKRSLQSPRAAVYWTMSDYFFGRTGSPSSSYYTGSAVRPVPYLVTYTTGNGSTRTVNALKLGTDYEMSYTGNVNAGTATATVTGIGSYGDAVSGEFSIVPTPLNRTAVSGLGSLTYTGSPQTPVPTLTLSLDGSYVLKQGADFEIGSYANNVDASANTADGHASMVVSGKGNFSGTYTLGFTIDPASLSRAAVSAGGWTYDGRAHDPNVSVSLDGTRIAQAGNWTYAVTRDGAAVDASAALDAGTYVVTATGQGNYADSASTTFTVAKRSIAGATVRLAAASYAYDGSAKEPVVSSVVLPDGTTLGAGDYSVSYSSNVNAGTATVTVTGAGNYTGSASASFVIERATIESALLSQSSYVYDGSAKSPALTVTGSGGRVLTEGAEYYVIAPEGRTNVGEYTYTVLGVGNYTGVVEAGFAISADSLPVYRLYNPNSGEHHYTLSAAERDWLVPLGWRYEGVAWQAPSISSAPVYRVYNPNAGDHHYTLSAGERDHLVKVGWRDEGQAWYSDDAQGAVLYRLYNPNAIAGAHHYTLSAVERDMLVGVGWNYEGTAWYSMV